MGLTKTELLSQIKSELLKKGKKVLKYMNWTIIDRDKGFTNQLSYLKI